MNIGFIGLGTMGAPMAGHLADAGHALFTSLNRSPLPTPLSGKQIEVLDSPRDVAAKADIIITILPDTPDVEAVLFGEEGVIAGVSADKLVVDMSSISPIATKQFAERFAALGCGFVDAPVSGGEVGAKSASLTIMCGGEEASFERARPLLEAMGKSITLVGKAGHGQICKVANQIIVALTIEAVGEGLLFASKAGADPKRVREALMGGFGSSRILELHGERMITRSFDPGFRIELHQKDLKLALESARMLGVALPNTASTQELFSACAAHGGNAEDHSALVKALEMLAAHKVAG